MTGSPRSSIDELLIDEERHIDFLETQIELIKQLGVQLYSQSHMGGLEDSKGGM